MKLSLIAFCFFVLFTSVSAFAQKKSNEIPSKLKPDRIFWILGTDTVDFKRTSKEKFQKPDSIMLVLEFNNLSPMKAKEIEFEVNWYKYSSTRRYLNDNQQISVTIDSTENKKLKQYHAILRSKSNRARRGWCEIEVRCMLDNRMIFMEKKKSFGIMLK